MGEVALTPKNLSEQTLALPSGAGQVSSAGQTFQVGGYAGTGSYSLPIPAPAGHAEIGPSLSLSYDTQGGAGIAGLGWGLSLASIQRRIDRGIPSFDNAEDTFTLQGDEFIPLAGGLYRFRIETRFARVQHVQSGTDDYWVVTERDGTRVFYGEDPDHQVRDDFDRIAVWYPSRKRDVHGNEVTYGYSRDTTTFDVRLTTVSWAGCYRISLTYEDRPDPIWSARRGFAHVQDKRLLAIALEVRLTSDSSWFTFREYALSYTTSSLTGRSLLTAVTVTCSAPGQTDRTLPGLTFGYTEGFDDRAFVEVDAALPPSPLSDANVTLVRQSGSGLPDILASTEGGHWLWVNRGEAAFDPPVRVPAPVAAMLAEERAFISDMTGDGWGDLVVAGGMQIFHARPGGGWSTPMIKGTAPNVDLDGPDVRVLDLNGDGIPDALRMGAKGVTYFENLGDGEWAPGIPIAHSPPYRLDDPRAQLADINGDGLPDLVYMNRGRIEVWPGLGRGRFGESYLLENAPSYGSDFDPSKVRWADLTGSGQADLLYVENGQVTVYLNQAGVLLAAGVQVSQLQLGSVGHVEPVDLRGNGASGLLFTDRGTTRRAWRYLDLFPEGSPDLLQTVENGIGGTTIVQYGSSALHWKRDKEALAPWRSHMPFVQRVVDRVTITDETTGLELSTEYQYHHGVYDGVEREFRGFARVEQYDTESDPDAEAPLIQAMVRRWFHCGTDLDLDDEYSTEVSSTPLAHSYPVTRPALRALRGVMVREETYTLDDLTKPYLVSESGYTVYAIEQGTDGQWSYAPLPKTSRSTYTERGTEERILETTTTYDLDAGPGFGLPEEVREEGTGRATTDGSALGDQQAEDLERYVTMTYLDALDDADTDFDDPTYLVGKVAQVERYTGADVLLAREKYFYDGIDFQGKGYPGSSTTAGLVAGDKGLLKCKLVFALTDSLVTATYPSGSGASAALTARGDYLADGTSHYVHAERYQYTAEGLVEVFRDAGGNDLTFSYDATYDLFPIGAEDAAGNPTTLTRGELPFQVEEVVDANGNHATLGYDATGLPAWKAIKGKEVSSGVWEGDDETYPTEEYAYDFTVQPIQVLLQVRQTRHGDTFDVYRYIDGVGRTLQERHTAEPDPATPTTPRFRVTGWVEYNQKGKPYRAFQPTFGSASTFAEPSGTAYIQTTYDPLGRPIRIDHPDGTFETTSFHPWYQTFSDRNDNAGEVAADDPRYGRFLKRFADHLDTPTLTYVDAFGRQIAVSEDVGTLSELRKSFRVTSYAVTFSGTTHEVTLEHPLAPNYFVMVQGGVATSIPTPDNACVAVSTDPFGTGDLSTSSGETKLGLARGASGQGDWVGTVVVWECLGDSAGSGFTLVDVKSISASSGSAGANQVTNATSAAWTDLAQVALYGGPRGGGVSTAASVGSQYASTWGKLVPSGTTSLALTRYSPTTSLQAATFTVYVVQWGSEHTIQRVPVTGSNGGDGVDATGEYNTAAIDAVNRARTWLWMSGLTQGEDIGDSFIACTLALGNGVATNEEETTVAVGTETAVTKDILVTVHSHPQFDVDWRFKTDGGSGDTSYVHDVPGPLAEEKSDAGETEGTRLALQHQTSEGTGTHFERLQWHLRPTDREEATATRGGSGQPWTAWVQTVDVGLVEGLVERVVTEPTATLRVTAYEISGSTFSGITYDLTLEQDLGRHYFVMIRGTEDATSADADSSGVRVTQDPFGTGDLAASSGGDVIRLERGAAATAWQGVVLVIESLVDEEGAGFRLVDVVEAVTGTGVAATEEATTVRSARTWDDLDQVAVYGGPGGGGATVASADQDHFASLYGKISPSGTDTITVKRWSNDRALKAATFTLYVVEWGSEHTIERVSVTGSAGGAGADATSEYDTATIDSAARDQTWLWMSGWTKKHGAGDSFNGLVLALGDGVAQNAAETTVAVGAHFSTDKDVLVTVHTHPTLAVDWRFKSSGDSGVETHAVTVDATTESSLRWPIWTSTTDSSSMSTFEAGVFWAKHTASTTVTGTRAASGTNFAAWVQSVDAAAFVHRRRHVTRTVFDLKDQPVEVWDARELSDPTWEFAYDYAGQRLVTAYLTAMGTRHGLPDAAGNPIWSRDARAIEVDRTFDALNRPLTETDDDGSTQKLRRTWTYIDYDALDTTSPLTNLFGRLEESRDADGVHFFEYDWRGLPTKVSHKFWSQKDSGTAWTSGSHSMWSGDWDPAISSTARASYTDWLDIPALGASGASVQVIAISTAYDAAGRPTQVTYPQSMLLDRTYNEAGLLEQVRTDRGTGSGWQTVIEDCTYNARGQVTGFTHGNGVETTREYDEDLERLGRIFTSITAGDRFQDLRYAYDPAGNPVAIEDALRHDTFKANAIIPNTRQFWYDARYRLVRATGRQHATVQQKGDATVTSSPDPNDYDPYNLRYAYDEVGNFVRNQEYTGKRLHYKATRIDLFNGDADEATNDDPELGNWTYDDNGCATHTPRHEELRYTFDSQPRYVDMDGGGQVYYFRNADQRVVRMLKKTGVDALGIYLGAWEYHWRDATTDYAKVVLHAEGHGRNAQVERVFSGSDADSLSLFFVHGDHLQSGHVLTKTDGTLLSQEEYFPYGRSSDRRDARNRYRYIGVERDEDTGLGMTGPRTYDPIVGRFFQGDPIGTTKPGWSAFACASASPINRTDPSGYDDLPIESSQSMCRPTGDDSSPPTTQDVIAPPNLQLPEKQHALHVDRDLDYEARVTSVEVETRRADVAALIDRVIVFEGDSVNDVQDRARLDAALDLILETDVGVSLLSQTLYRAEEAGAKIFVSAGHGEATPIPEGFRLQFDPTAAEQHEVAKDDYERGPVDAVMIFHEFVHILDMQTGHPDMVNRHEVTIDGITQGAHEAAAIGIGSFEGRYFSENTFRTQLNALVYPFGLEPRKHH